MHSVALRALGAAALAVSQTTLTVTTDGTYLTEVVLDSVPVTLLVDTLTSGVWVRCTAIETNTCADGIYTSTSGYTTSEFRHLGFDVPVKTKRFAEVKIAGQIFHGFDATVVYHDLDGLGPSVHGVLGLRNSGATSMYLDGQVSTVALQLGLNTSDSKLSFDSVDKALLKKKGLTTEVEMDEKILCFQIPFENGSLPTNECPPTYTETAVNIDPASIGIGLSDTIVERLERRFLYSCTKITYPIRFYSTLRFVCNETVKLPRLTVTMGSWNFFLDPEDYTTPSTNSSAIGKQVNVLVGEADYMYRGIVLGAPFLRKFPVNFNMVTSKITVYCAENSTCTKVPPPPRRTYSPSSGTSGGTSGGGGGTSVGGGGGYGISVDVETSRKRKKLYLGIGLGVAGVAILAVFGCCCKSNDTTDDDAKDEEDVELEITVEEEKAGSSSSEKTVSGAVKAESSRKKLDNSHSDSGSSLGDESQSSEEERLVRRVLHERRRHRRERRKEKEAKRLQANGSDGGKGSSSGETSAQDDHYVAASSPKSKPSVLQ